MNRRDVMFFLLAAGGLLAVLFVKGRGTVAPIIGRIGSTITLGADAAGIASAVAQATKPTETTPAQRPPGAFVMGSQWYSYAGRQAGFVPWGPYDPANP